MLLFQLRSLIFGGYYMHPITCFRHTFGVVAFSNTSRFKLPGKSHEWTLLVGFCFLYTCRFGMRTALLLVVDLSTICSSQTNLSIFMWSPGCKETEKQNRNWWTGWAKTKYQPRPPKAAIFNGRRSTPDQRWRRGRRGRRDWGEEIKVFILWVQSGHGVFGGSSGVVNATVAPCLAELSIRDEGFGEGKEDFEGLLYFLVLQ